MTLIEKASPVKNQKAKSKSEEQSLGSVLHLYLSMGIKKIDNAGNPRRKPEREGKTITVGKKEDVPAGRGATVELLNGSELALFNVDGQFYAIENSCPHRGAPLADGRLVGPVVECDWHGWRFDVRTGDCLTTNCPIESYKVIIEDGWIRIFV